MLHSTSLRRGDRWVSNTCMFYYQHELQRYQFFTRYQVRRMWQSLFFADESPACYGSLAGMDLVCVFRGPFCLGIFTYIPAFSSYGQDGHFLNQLSGSMIWVVLSKFSNQYFFNPTRPFLVIIPWSKCIIFIPKKQH